MGKKNKIKPNGRAIPGSEFYSESDSDQELISESESESEPEPEHKPSDKSQSDVSSILKSKFISDSGYEFESDILAGLEEELLYALNSIESFELLDVNRGVLPEFLEKAVDSHQWNLVKNLCLLEKRNRVQEPNYIHLKGDAPFARACLEAVRQEEWAVVKAIVQSQNIVKFDEKKEDSLETSDDTNLLLVHSDILNQIIDILADAKKWDLVAEILKLEPPQYKPNSFALDETLNSALVYEKWDIVTTILNKAEYIPDASVLDNLLEFAAENQKWDLVKETLKNPECKPSAPLLNALLKCVANDQQWDLFKSILKIPGYKPELNQVLNAVASAHQWNLVKEILKTPGYIPEKNTLNHVLNIFADESQWDLLYDLLNLGLDPQHLEISVLNKLMYVTLTNQKWDLIHYIILNLAKEYEPNIFSDKALALYSTNTLILEKIFEAVSFECDPSIDPSQAWQAKETLEKLLRQWGKLFKPEVIEGVAERLIQHGYQEEDEENQRLWKLINKHCSPKQLQTYLSNSDSASESDPEEGSIQLDSEEEWQTDEEPGTPELESKQESEKFPSNSMSEYEESEYQKSEYEYEEEKTQLDPNVESEKEKGSNACDVNLGAKDLRKAGFFKDKKDNNESNDSNANLSIRSDSSFSSLTNKVHSV